MVHAGFVFVAGSRYSSNPKIPCNRMNVYADWTAVLLSSERVEYTSPLNGRIMLLTRQQLLEWSPIAVPVKVAFVVL